MENSFEEDDLVSLANSFIDYEADSFKDDDNNNDDGFEYDGLSKRCKELNGYTERSYGFPTDEGLQYLVYLLSL